VAAFVERARDNEGDENEEEMDEFSSEEEDDFLGLDEDVRVIWLMYCCKRCCLRY
jgi:hypothetical protein